MGIFNELFDGSIFDSFEKNSDIEKLDFSKKEDVEKAEKILNEAKEWFGELFNTDTIDYLMDKIHEIYEKKQEELKKKEEQKKLPVQPSTEVSEKVKNNITNMAVEYVDTMIYPNIDNFTEDKRKSVIDALVDFACWMYKK